MLSTVGIWTRISIGLEKLLSDIIVVPIKLESKQIVKKQRQSDLQDIIMDVLQRHPKLAYYQVDDKILGYELHTTNGKDSNVERSCTLSNVHRASMMYAQHC